METFVEIVQPDGTSERFPVESEQVTLGRAANAGISVPTAVELELEHLLLAPRGREGCWVSTSQSASTPTLVKGKPFASGIVPWGAELTIGRVKVRLTNKRPAVKRAAKGGGIHPMILLASAGTAVLAGWWFFGRGEPELEPPADVDAPALFGDAPGCPSGDASANAQTAEYQAHSRGDRHQFDPRDGVAAVELYGEAAACYREAGMAEKAAAMETEREQMRIAVDAEYAGRRLRLHHALQTQDFDKAIGETLALSKLVDHLPDDDPYVEWLDRARRVLVARRERERSERERSRRERREKRSRGR